ncbi:hypothetical protein [Pleomorphomonas sp. PLEO]|uniref:hypothetical protein n=1 Tax=Pleomorphomonas sp. PLEO TaxID=3239306 RepID=UPI00351E899D
MIRPAQHIEATLSTLRREAVTMRSVFKHAVRLGYLKASDIPKIDLVAEERNKRPSFTDAEIAKPMEVAEQRMIDVLDIRKRGKQSNIWKGADGKDITSSVKAVGGLSLTGNATVSFEIDPEVGMRVGFGTSLATYELYVPVLQPGSFKPYTQGFRPMAVA